MNYKNILAVNRKINFAFLLVNFFTPSRILWLRVFNFNDVSKYYYFWRNLSENDRENLITLNHSFWLVEENDLMQVDENISRWLTNIFGKFNYETTQNGKNLYNIYYKKDNKWNLLIIIFALVLFNCLSLILFPINNIFWYFAISLVVIMITKIIINVGKVHEFYTKSDQHLEYKLNEYIKAYNYFVVEGNMTLIRNNEYHVINARIQKYLLNYHEQFNSNDTIVNSFELDKKLLDVNEIICLINIQSEVIETVAIENFVYKNEYTYDEKEAKNKLIFEKFLIDININANNIIVKLNLEILKYAGDYYAKGKFKPYVSDAKIPISINTHDSLLEDFLLNINKKENFVVDLLNSKLLWEICEKLI